MNKSVYMPKEYWEKSKELVGKGYFASVNALVRESVAYTLTQHGKDIKFDKIKNEDSSDLENV